MRKRIHYRGAWQMPSSGECSASSNNFCTSLPLSDKSGITEGSCIANAPDGFHCELTCDAMMTAVDPGKIVGVCVNGIWVISDDTTSDVVCEDNCAELPAYVDTKAVHVPPIFQAERNVSLSVKHR